MTNTQNNLHSFWQRTSWLTVILAILTVVTFIAVSNPGVRYAVQLGTRGVMMENAGSSGAVPSVPADVSTKSIDGLNYPEQGMMDLSYPYPYQNPDVPVTDTRELMKTYYSASMRTRDVQGLTRRVETTVRGYSGRIDQQASSPKYGFISFSVPQSKYDAFRTELESMVGSRFLTVNISSQNLLPQKLSIEEQQTQADKALADYTMAREDITTAHTAAVQSLQSKIDDDEQQLIALRAKPETPKILAEIQAVSSDLALQKRRLDSENALYSTRLKNADRNIKFAEDRQKAVQTQDKTLLDNVATVTGIVSVQWISLWNTVLLYLPGYSIPSIFAVLTIFSVVWDRRKLS
ncbi:MAG: hypothetical protein WC817_03090 [Patescibacteria group bacterium]|jgi:hypothetical protein